MLYLKYSVLTATAIILKKSPCRCELEIAIVATVLGISESWKSLIFLRNDLYLFPPSGNSDFKETANHRQLICLALSLHLLCLLPHFSHRLYSVSFFGRKWLVVDVFTLSSWLMFKTKFLSSLPFVRKIEKKSTDLTILAGSVSVKSNSNVDFRQQVDQCV